MAKLSALERATVTITAETQAERLAGLVALAEASGTPARYSDVAQRLADSDTKIGRTSWYDLLDPGQRVSKIEILVGVARYFKVEPEFLIREEAPSPEGFTEALDEMNETRAREFVTFAARQALRLPPAARKLAIAGLREVLDTGDLRSA